MGFLPEKKYMYILIVPQNGQNKNRMNGCAFTLMQKYEALSQKIEYAFCKHLICFKMKTYESA